MSDIGLLLDTQTSVLLNSAKITGAVSVMTVSPADLSLM
jgi:hypothetical protein